MFEPTLTHFKYIGIASLVIGAIIIVKQGGWLLLLGIFLFGFGNDLIIQVERISTTQKRMKKLKTGGSEERLKA